VKITLTSLGKSLTPAPAARPAHPARPAVSPWKASRRGCRKASRSTSTRRAGAVGVPKWPREFEDPIVLADGLKLVTLRDAATYITKSAKDRTGSRDMADRGRASDPSCRERRRLDLAGIGVLKALHRNLVREFNPDRKEPHWGNRKRKRDK
jgi:hypothetical protein